MDPGTELVDKQGESLLVIAEGSGMWRLKDANDTRAIHRLFANKSILGLCLEDKVVLESRMLVRSALC
jgi:hypothetical protein